MATDTVKIPLDGEAHEGTRIELRETTEPWTRVELADGSSIRIKHVIVDVVRLRDRFDSDGAPVYVVKSANIMAVECPDHLRRDAQGSPEELQ